MFRTCWTTTVKRLILFWRWLWYLVFCCWPLCYVFYHCCLRHSADRYCFICSVLYTCDPHLCYWCGSTSFVLRILISAFIATSLFPVHLHFFIVVILCYHSRAFIYFILLLIHCILIFRHMHFYFAYIVCNLVPMLWYFITDITALQYPTLHCCLHFALFCTFMTDIFCLLSSLCNHRKSTFSSLLWYITYHYHFVFAWHLYLLSFSDIIILIVFISFSTVFLFCFHSLHSAFSHCLPFVLFVFIFLSPVSYRLFVPTHLLLFFHLFCMLRIVFAFDISPLRLSSLQFRTFHSVLRRATLRYSLACLCCSVNQVQHIPFVHFVLFSCILGCCHSLRACMFLLFLFVVAIIICWYICDIILHLSCSWCVHFCLLLRVRYPAFRDSHHTVRHCCDAFRILFHSRSPFCFILRYFTAGCSRVTGRARHRKHQVKRGEQSMKKETTKNGIKWEKTYCSVTSRHCHLFLYHFFPSTNLHSFRPVSFLWYSFILLHISFLSYCPYRHCQPTYFISHCHLSISCHVRQRQTSRNDVRRRRVERSISVHSSRYRGEKSRKRRHSLARSVRARGGAAKKQNMRRRQSGDSVMLFLVTRDKPGRETRERRHERAAYRRKQGATSIRSGDGGNPYLSWLYLLLLWLLRLVVIYGIPVSVAVSATCSALLWYFVVCCRVPLLPYRRAFCSFYRCSCDTYRALFFCCLIYVHSAISCYRYSSIHILLMMRGATIDMRGRNQRANVRVAAAAHMKKHSLLCRRHYWCRDNSGWPASALFCLWFIVLLFILVPLMLFWHFY